MRGFVPSISQNITKEQRNMMQLLSINIYNEFKDPIPKYRWLSLRRRHPGFDRVNFPQLITQIDFTFTLYTITLPSLPFSPSLLPAGNQGMYWGPNGTFRKTDALFKPFTMLKLLKGARGGLCGVWHHWWPLGTTTTFPVAPQSGGIRRSLWCSQTCHMKGFFSGSKKNSGLCWPGAGCERWDGTQGTDLSYLSSEVQNGVSCY